MLKLILIFSVLFNYSYAQNSLSPAEAKLMKMEAMRLWQKRDDQQSLEESISKFEMVYESEPQNLEVLTYLARGYFTLAELHQTNDDIRLKTFEKATNYGERGLLLNPDYQKLAEKDADKAIDKLTKREVPIAYWTAASLGKWSMLNGVMSSLRHKNKILSLVKKVEKLAPDFYYSAVPRFWGGYYAVAPRIAGRDMKKSKQYFKKAMEKSPELLTNKVLYAELYLVEDGDKKEFRKVLLDVISSSNGPRDIIPENLLEKRKAERLLEKTDKLF